MNRKMALGRHNELTVPAVGSIEAYICSVNALPRLDAEAELALADRFRRQNDLEAAQQLVLANLRSVVHIARGYLGYGLPLADLIQEGNIGLMKAVKRFDPAVGVRLISFAIYWIRFEIHEYVIRNWRIVKVATTKAQRKLFFKLRSAKKRLAWMNQGEVEAVAADLKVTPEEVTEMECRLSSRDIPLHAEPAEDDGSGHWLPNPEQYLKAEGGDPEQQLVEGEAGSAEADRLKTALTVLDERSLDIVQNRWLAPKKEGLQVLADRYGISAERVRQIELRAIKKLRTAIA